MDSICRIVGERIRRQRNLQGLSQEELAERAGLHHTYIGQLERGEKNATLESIHKVVNGLGIRFEILFSDLPEDGRRDGLLDELRQIFGSLSKKEQQAMLEVLRAVMRYRDL